MLAADAIADVWPPTTQPVPTTDPELLAAVLQTIPGVVEHGLFIGLADIALIGTASGVDVIAAPDDEDEAT